MTYQFLQTGGYYTATRILAKKSIIMTNRMRGRKSKIQESFSSPIEHSHCKMPAHTAMNRTFIRKAGGEGFCAARLMSDRPLRPI